MHRLVVLPDYQGVGIGTKFISAIAEMYAANGYDFNLTTTTPALVNALKRRPEWILARFGRAKENYTGYSQRYAGNNIGHLSNTTSNKRITFSFWYKRK